MCLREARAAACGSTSTSTALRFTSLPSSHPLHRRRWAGGNAESACAWRVTHERASNAQL
jgi:hypothetical protein